MGRKPAPSRGRPSFFKVLIGDFSSKLRIPPAFVANLDGVLLGKFLLQSHANQLWPVTLEKIGSTLFFTDGWRAFVQANSLDVGDFVTFEYAGDKFQVHAFGKNCCEKNLVTVKNEAGENQQNTSVKPKVVSGVGRSIHRHVRKKDAGDSKDSKERIIIHLDENENSEPDDCKRTIQEEIARRKASLRSSISPVKVTHTAKERALQAANKFCPSFPSFKVQMRPSYVQMGALNIPQSFVQVHMGSAPTQLVQLKVSDRLWTVTLLIYPHRGTKLSCGWVTFARDNNLRKGDVCVFELINESPIVFYVSIYKRNS